jgi:hypothetical protein
MGIYFLIKSPSGGGGEEPSYGPNNPPMATGWYDMTDDTYWESPSPVGEGGTSYCSWNGSAWVTNYLGMYDINNYQFMLTTKSGTTWAEWYWFRPTQVRITHTANDPFSSSIEVWDFGENIVGTANFCPSPVTITLNLVPYASILDLVGGADTSSHTLTKIEFYVDETVWL